MFAIAGILVLAYAVAINALALQPSTCTPGQIGSVSSWPHPQDRVFLSPNIADWEVQIPVHQQCPSGVAGVTATTCDSDVAPSVQFLSEEVLYVHRNGRQTDFATVDITVYCVFVQVPQNAPLGSNAGLSLQKPHGQQPQGLVARPQ